MSTRVSSESEYSAGSGRCQNKRFLNLWVWARQSRARFLGGFLILAGDWGHVHDRPAEICKAHHGQFPAMLKRVEACDHQGDRCKAQREEGEHCEQFLNEVKFGHHDDCQEPPQPFATVVRELRLHGSLLCPTAVCTLSRSGSRNNAPRMNCGWTAGESRRRALRPKRPTESRGRDGN